jgi:hypothetical protein
MKSKSNLTIVLVPLLTMFSSASRIDPEHVLGAVTDFKDSVSTNSLIKGNNQAYIINLVVSLIKGTPLLLSSKSFSPR